MSEDEIRTFRITVTNENMLSATWRDATLPQVKVPIGAEALERKTIEALINMLRTSRLKEPSEYQLLGEHLYATLFHENIIGTKLLEIIREGGDPFRLELVFESKQHMLASWPWEYLYWPEREGETASGKFLANLGTVLLTRHLRLDTTPQDPELKESELPLRILVVATGPRKGKPDEYYQEVGARPIEFDRLLEVLQSLRDKTKRVLPDGSEQYRIKISPFVEDEKATSYRVSLNNFINYCKVEKPHVIHFVGHGRFTSEKGGELLFMKPEGIAQWVSETRLADELFALHTELKTLKLIFLSACESGREDPKQAVSGLARRLAHNDIPVVVGMQYTAEQLDANELAALFYQALVQPLPIEVAVQTARTELARDMTDEQRSRVLGLPVLYIRKSGALLPKLPESGTTKGATPSSVPTETKPQAAPPQQPMAVRPPPQAPIAFSGTRDVTTVQCVWCGTVSEDAKAAACMNCGANLRCPNCETEILQRGNFCSICTHPIKGDQRPTAVPSTSPIVVRVTSQG